MDNLFLSCDWGTSTFRLKLANLQTGEIRDSITTNAGIKKVHDEWIERGSKTNRMAYLMSYLSDRIKEIENRINNRLNGIPLVISGMASSSLGLKELPYTSLPLDIKPSQLKVFTREADPEFPHKLILISGIKSANDIIRGEETQIIAIVTEYRLDNATIVLPGTHSKHVFIQDHQIVNFKTYMTGELFDLLSTKSILKDSLSREDGAFDIQAFLRGVREGENENILHSLFKVRAFDILNIAGNKENFAFLSGLLVGLELKELQGMATNQLILAGEGGLQAYYAEALRAMNLKEKTSILSNKEIEHLIVKGHRFILQGD